MFTDDFNALYIRFHMGNETVNNQYIDALYISQLCFVPGDVVTQPNTSFDAGIPNVSAYTWVVKNASGEQKASGNHSSERIKRLQRNKKKEYKGTKKTQSFMKTLCLFYQIRYLNPELFKHLIEVGSRYCLVLQCNLSFQYSRQLRLDYSVHQILYCFFLLQHFL